MSNQEENVTTLTSPENNAVRLTILYLKYHQKALDITTSNLEFKDIIQEMAFYAGVDDIPFLFDEDEEPVTSSIQTYAILEKLGYSLDKQGRNTIEQRWFSIGPRYKLPLIEEIKVRDILNNHFLIQHQKNLEKLRGMQELSLTEAGNVKDEKTEIIPIDVPPDTKWEDITIDFIDKENIKITIKGNTPISKHYAEIGFKDKKRNNPIKAWTIFLSFACVDNGINTKNTHFDLTTLTNRRREINDRLKEVFKGIDGNPISSDWKPAFNIPYNSNLKAHLESLETQDDSDN